MRPELGNLRPIRLAVASIHEWEQQDRERRGDDDDVVRALRKVRESLERAIEDAQHANLEEGLTVAQYADLEDIEPSAAYKRIRKNKVPVKRTPSGLRVLLDNVA